MRIVNLTQFLALPANTVFAKYAPCYFEALQIKGDSLLESRDFLNQQIADAIDCHDSGEFAAKLDAAEHDGMQVGFDFNCLGRDGCFDEGQLFAVWEREDVLALIERLKECV